MDQDATQMVQNDPINNMKHHMRHLLLIISDAFLVILSTFDPIEIWILLKYGMIRLVEVVNLFLLACWRCCRSTST